MRIHKQLSVFLENSPGALARVCRAFAEEKIDIVAHSVSDSIDYSVFRCVVSDPLRAVHMLETTGSFVLEEDVLELSIGNSPGSLGEIAEKLAAAGINIHYAYGSAPQNGSGARLILKTNDLKRTGEVLA
jgi:hypothetical protein